MKKLRKSPEKLFEVSKQTGNKQEVSLKKRDLHQREGRESCSELSREIL